MMEDVVGVRRRPDGYTLFLQLLPDDASLADGPPPDAEALRAWAAGIDHVLSVNATTDSGMFAINFARKRAVHTGLTRIAADDGLLGGLQVVDRGGLPLLRFVGHWSPTVRGGGVAPAALAT